MGRRIARLLFVAVLLPGCSGAGEETVEVALEHSRFVLERARFEVGDTVTFVIRNTDPIDHEFILGDEAVQQHHERGTEKRHGDVPGEVTVPAGGERTSTFTFTRAGTLILGCHLPGHYDYGMRTEVRVTT